jgi:hypothetical protein
MADDNVERHVILGAGPLGTVLARKLQQIGKQVSGLQISLWSIMGNPAYDMPEHDPNLSTAPTWNK